MSLSDYGSLESLDETHLEAIGRALRNILALPLALETYAQILDGLPLSDIAWESTKKMSPRHPINGHVALCKGVMERAVEIRRDFDLGILTFKPEASFPHSS